MLGDEGSWALSDGFLDFVGEFDARNYFLSYGKFDVPGI